MNVSNIIEQLQRKSQETDDSLTLMTLSKMIEQLQLGEVEVVSTVNDLPALPLEENGQLYLVENDSQLYYNVNDGLLLGEGWRNFPLEEENLGVVFSWGRGFNGRLGTGDTTDKSSPVTAAGDITDWSAISAGQDHSLGVTDTGVLYAWGEDNRGQLGTGNEIDRSSPVTVAGGIANWSSVAAGREHSFGVTDTGVLYAWGRGDSGRLGTGDRTDRSSPVTVVGGITNWSSIAAGSVHNLGLTDTGVLYAWGDNQWGSAGLLGTGDEIPRSSPVTVVGGITNWSSVDAGERHNLGVTDTGVLYAWGNGTWGILGTGDTVNKSSPVTVAGGITDWSSIAASRLHSLGVTDTGVLYAWGNNGDGQLGTGDTTDRSSPVTVVGGITNWSSVAGGVSAEHSFGVTDTGVLYAWGENSFAQLGTGDEIDRSSPVTVVGGITNWSSISAGDHGLTIVSGTFNKRL